MPRSAAPRRAGSPTTGRRGLRRPVNTAARRPRSQGQFARRCRRAADLAESTCRVLCELTCTHSYCSPVIGTVRGGVYVAVRCPSVCLSVLSVIRCSRVRRVCCWEPRQQAPGAQQQRRRSSTARSSKCEQCRVSSRCRRLNTDLLLTKTDRMVCAKSFLGRIWKVIRRRGLGQSNG